MQILSTQVIINNQMCALIEMSSSKQRKLQNQRLADIARHALLEREIIALRNDLELAEDEEIELQSALKEAQRSCFDMLTTTTSLEDHFEDYRVDKILGVGFFRNQ